MTVVELRAGAAGWAPAAFGEPPRWRTHRTFLLLPGTHPIRPSGFALIRIASDGRASDGGGGALASWEWEARRVRAESPRKCSDGIAGSGRQSADWLWVGHVALLSVYVSVKPGFSQSDIEGVWSADDSSLTVTMTN
jgi:hypothetical protein